MQAAPAPAWRRPRVNVDDLLPLVHDELRRLADRYLQRERQGHTLQPTALLNEAYLRVKDRSPVDREHLLAIVAQAMRRVLVDHARHRNRLRRGGDRERIEFDEPVTTEDAREFDVVEFDDVLTALSRHHARSARIVELRVFGGLTVVEIATLLEISPRTVDNDWAAARAWLARALRHDG